MKNIKYFILAIGLLMIDQLSKIFISSSMDLYQSNTIIDNFFKIYYVRNSGGAFSILEGNMILFYLVALVVSGFVIKLLFSNKDINTNLNKNGLMFILAGTLGNFIDRLLFKEVIDFLSFTFFGYNFAIFNFADVFVFIGFGLVIINQLIHERRLKNERI